MLIKSSALKSLIEAYIFENENESDDNEKEFETTKYVKDSNKIEHKIEIGVDSDVLTLHINDQHFNPKGVAADKKLQNAFLTVAAAVALQHADDPPTIKKMISLIKKIDLEQSDKSDKAVLQSIMNKRGRPPYSQLDDLLNMDKF